MGKLDDLFHVGENLSGEAFRNFMCKYNGKLYFIWVVHLHEKLGYDRIQI